MTRIISIASSKGGVGKTTVSVNLSYALSEILKKKVLLIDGNITTSHISLSIDIPNKNTLNEALRRFRIETEKYKSLEILPSSISPYDLKNIDIERFPELIKAVENKYDFIIVDSPPGLGKEALSILKGCEEILIVSLPFASSIVDVFRIMKIAKNMKILGLVLNEVRKKPYEFSSEEMSSFTNLKVLASIPFDKKVYEALSLKKPVVEYSPRCKASKEFIILAHKIAESEYKDFNLLKRLKEFSWQILHRPLKSKNLPTF
jgi:septum site-determining protein MinD